MYAYDRFVAAAESTGRRVKQTGPGVAMVQCPAHDDGNPSLSIRQAREQLLVYCFAGCGVDDVLEALGLGKRDLFDRPNGTSYDYRDTDGTTLLREVFRSPTKSFRQKVHAKDKVTLYRLPQLLAAVNAGRDVWLCEGEKDVDVVVSLGEEATSAPQGASNFNLVDATPLHGAHVLAVVDTDEAGQRWAVAVHDALKGKAASLVFLRPLDGADLADHVLRGHSLDDLVPLTGDPPFFPSGNAATPQHLASEPDILAVFGATVERLGLVGEDRLAKLLYLVVTSRLLDRQVSAGVKGHSSSGKSWTVDVVLRFFPDEACIKFTAMSQKALIYSDQEYSHRTLVVYEATALRETEDEEGAAYYIRTLLSEGRIEYPVTVRDKDGGFTTRTIVKEGPTNLLFTTTRTRVHAENETRILSLNTDDSTEQTRRVLDELAQEDGHRDDILDDWLELQRWLAGQGNQTTIPYAKQLIAAIPAVAVRLRRDVRSLLALIRAHALLHQASRGRDHHGRVVATIDDYAVVRDLVADILAEGVGATVSATVRATVAAVDEASIASVDAGGRAGASVRDIAARLGVDKSNASRRLRAAADGGFIRNQEDKRGKPAQWVIGDSLPETSALLPTPGEVLRSCGDIREKERAEPSRARTGTCEACGQPMTLIYPGQTTHPGCDPKP